MVESWIKKVIEGIAGSRGLNVPDIMLMDGLNVGVLDVALLKLKSQGADINNAFVKNDLERLETGVVPDRLAVKLYSAVLALQLKTSTIEA